MKLALPFPGSLKLLAFGVSVVVGTGVARASAGEGQAVFQAVKCIACHKLNGKVGPQQKVLHGPVLDHIASKPGHDRAWFSAYLKDPTSRIKDARMPKMELTDQQIGALADYLVTLK